MGCWELRAATENVAVLPRAAVVGTGCVVIVGATITTTVAPELVTSPWAFDTRTV